MLRLILLLLVVIPVAVAGQEQTGQTRQAIVGGSPIAPMMREEYGLLSISNAAGGSCSATLLTNEWLITAAHCLVAADVADPRRISVVASWQTEQTRQGLEVRNFGPTPDIALIRTPAFRRFGTTTGYSRPLLANGLDDLRHWPITTYGRGIHVLATGSGPTATPSQSDGEYRHATTRIDRVEGSLYWFPANENYQIIAGGDSGGPSFVRSQRGMELAGVHSDCRIYCLPGKVCKNDWQWVMGIPECADAPVALVASEIRKIISERRIDVTQDLPEARRTGGARVSSVGRLDPNTPLSASRPNLAALTGSEVSFQASNLLDHYIRHRQFLAYAEPVAGDLGRRDSTFRIVPGLAGRCVSLESQNIPNHFLRHEGFRIKLAPRADTPGFRGDATFCLVAALAPATAAGTSLESVSHPGHYIRHRQRELWLDRNDGSELFRKDATFNIIQRDGTMIVR